MPRKTLLHRATVQEGLGKASVPRRSVLIDGDRVEAVLPEDLAPLHSPDVDVVDLDGRTVMPGMTLGHTHIAYLNVLDGREMLFKYSIPEVTLGAAENATRLLSLGYTAFVGAGSVSGIDMALRRAVDSGRLRGPRITPCSRDLMVSGPPERRNPEVKKRIPTDLMRLADTPEEMAEYVATEIAQGAEIVKVFSSGDDTFPNGRSHELLFTAEELKIASRTAHEHGARIRAHSRGLDGIRNAIAADVDVIDHATYADDAALEAIAERGIFVVPSLFQPYKLLTTGTRHGKTTDYLETLEFQAEIDNTLRILPLMVEMGIPVVAGDDFGFAWTPHGTYAEELELYVTMAGIPAATVLTWATANGARLAGRGGDAGTVEAGRLADLVITGDDPAEDITVLSRPGGIETVLLGGDAVAGSLDAYRAPSEAVR
ncbi:amidohydrolase family protein [Streptomyces griseoloalbus]|uniref:Imidazolonepropionase-like amidohydrolase n=1 Tax=Streptomyces griseoloalbus TaxID=67303 RepID=A0A7W8BNL8_9ACTN|nr:amidohydrolase family protein [Streptomyces albaduncus]MBB5124814.1 imidazolonepropionase-like amidohydrolase [Streptomyces albaduncus]GGW39598.1 dipeptidase [Streptomyces albaduncus]